MIDRLTGESADTIRHARPWCCPVRDLQAQVLDPVPIGLNCGNTLEGLSGAIQGGSGVASKSADTIGTRIGRMDDEQPVTLVASRFEEWADHYARFAAAILELLPEAHCEHIGSTSVPDLPAKDVIDVIVGVKVSSVQNAARALKMAGFDLEGMKPGHCWLAWPNRRHRESVVHVLAFEGTEWSARIAFRDLLREDPAARAEYFEAKKTAADTASGWSDYTAAKYPTVARLLTRTNPDTA